MKTKIKLFASLVAIFLLTSNVSMAGFYVKKDAHIIVATQPNQNKEMGTISGEQTHVTIKKRSFFSRIIHKIIEVEEAAIPQVLYIILAIFPLGWLGMGINDNFEGYNWLISLLLYILGWLPGLIYTLIMMKDYY